MNARDEDAIARIQRDREEFYKKMEAERTKRAYRAPLFGAEDAMDDVDERDAAALAELHDENTQHL